jgi:hypothetical protein
MDWESDSALERLHDLALEMVPPRELPQGSPGETAASHEKGQAHFAVVRGFCRALQLFPKNSHA